MSTKNFKKQLSLSLFAIVLSFALVACGGGAKKEEKPAAPVETKPAAAAPAEKKVVTPRELNRNLNARLAMGLSIDKTHIEEVILNNGSKAANYLVAKELCIDEKGVDFRAKYPDGFLATDKAKAKEYWAKAKAELGFDTITIELLCYDSDTHKKMAEFVQAQLETNLEGLKVTINQQPFKNKLTMMRAKQYDVDLASWGPDYGDPMTFLDMWIQGSGHNSADYKNPEYDAIINSCKSGDLSGKPAERYAALQEAEKMLIERDATLIPLYQTGMSWLTKPHLTGFQEAILTPQRDLRDAQTTKLTDGKKIVRLTSTADLPSMDQTKATDVVTFDAMAHVLEGLVEMTPDGKIIPAGAEKWEVSEDGKVYTFHLRKAGAWSNGTPVTAKDYVYSMRKLADPKHGSPYQFMLETAGVKNAVKIKSGELKPTDLGVEAKDDYTLVITLDVPVSFFLKLMAFPTFFPQNEAFVTSKGEAFGTNVENAIYNGPFVLTNWENGYGFQYKKNPKYWNADRIKIDGVTFRVVKDVAAVVNMYKSDEIDSCRITGEFVDTYQDSPEFQQRLQGGMAYFKFCQADSPK